MLELARPGDREAVNEIAGQVHEIHVSWRPDIYCAVEDYYSEDVMAEEPREESAEEESAGGTDLENTVASNRKLIRRVNMNVETQEFEKLTQYIEKKVSELGGYMEESNVYGGSYEYNERRKTKQIINC